MAAIFASAPAMAPAAAALHASCPAMPTSGLAATRPALRLRHKAVQPTRLSARMNELGEEDLEAQLEEFMARQAEIESGNAKRKVEPGQVLGAGEVSEDEAKAYCRDIVNSLKVLKQKRDMSVNEVKLTIAIEDPRARERRLMGMEDASGVSRDEMAEALAEVAEGRIPTDRIALRELHREIVNWPFLDPDEPQPRTGVAALSPATTPAADDAAAPWRREAGVRPPVGRDPNEKPQGIADMLPDWVGYGALYLVSIAPVLIALGVVGVLFANSLR